PGAEAAVDHRGLRRSADRPPLGGRRRARVFERVAGEVEVGGGPFEQDAALGRAAPRAQVGGQVEQRLEGEEVARAAAVAGALRVRRVTVAGEEEPASGWSEAGVVDPGGGEAPLRHGTQG